MPHFVTDLPAELRNAPAWALMLGGLVLIIVLLGSLPFTGWMIERKRRRTYENMRLVGFSGDNFFADQPGQSERLRFPSKVGNPQRFGALDVTFAGQPTSLLGLADSSPTTVVAEIQVTNPGSTMPTREWEEYKRSKATEETQEFTGPDWMPEVDDFENETEWNLDDEEMMERGPDDEPEVEPVISVEIDDKAKPRWAEQTGSWNVIEEWEAELKESEAAALAAFRADPLGAWYVPPAIIAESVKVEYLPEADRAFSAMFLSGRLTGVGVDIDAQWKSWNLEAAR